MDILVITSGVIVFLCISYLLVTVLFIAEKKLISQEDVQIAINDDPDKSFSIKPGGTLLSSLSNQNIFIKKINPTINGANPLKGSRVSFRRVYFGILTPLGRKETCRSFLAELPGVERPLTTSSFKLLRRDSTLSGCSTMRLLRSARSELRL